MVAITAVAGSIFAGQQLRMIRKSEGSQVDIEGANLLLRLDEKFESVELITSRRAWLVLRNRIEGDVRVRLSHNSLETLAKEVSTGVSNHLNELWKKCSELKDSETEVEKVARESATTEYMQLMNLIYWIETVGLLYKKDLIHRENLLELYDGVIIKTVGYMLEHIKFKSEQGPVIYRSFLENAIFIFEEAVEHKNKKEEPAQLTPRSSRIPW